MNRLLSILLLSFALLSPALATAEPVHAQEIEHIDQQPVVTSGNGSMTLTCPGDGHTYTFNIYSITGQLVKRVQFSQGSMSVDLPSGCYIVKCERWSKKVIVG